MKKKGIHALLVFLLIAQSVSLKAKTVLLDPANLPPKRIGSVSQGVVAFIANNIQSGDTLSIGSGTILLDGPVFLRDSMTIIGSPDTSRPSVLKRSQKWLGDPSDSSNNLIWNHYKNRWIWGNPNADEYGLISNYKGLGQLDHITIIYITFEGSNVSGVPDADYGTLPKIYQHLLYLGGSNVRIEHCVFRNSLAIGIKLEGGSDNIVTRCRVDNTAKDGIFVGGGRNITVSENYVTRTRDNAIAFDRNNVRANRGYCNGGLNSFFINNTIDNSNVDGANYRPGNIPGFNKAPGDKRYYSSYGIYVGQSKVIQVTSEGDTAHIDSLTIEGNTIISSWLHGIYISPLSMNIKIVNNRILGVKRYNGIVICNNVSDILVEGNEISDAGWYGITIGKNCARVTMNNNTIRRSGHEKVHQD